MVTLGLIFVCQTGRRVLIGSGAIKNNFPVSGELLRAALKFLEGDGTLQAHGFKGILVGISANQETFS